MLTFAAFSFLTQTPDELAPYTEQAEKDLQRYRREMDEYREGVARKTRLASEQKLREQEAEAAKAPQMPPSNPVAQAGFGANPWMMGAANPMMGFQNPTDPSFQLLLRQQLLQAQNPQFNAFFLQNQFGGMPGGPMQGFPGAMGQFDPTMGQQQQFQQQQPQQQMQQGAGGVPQGSAPNAAQGGQQNQDMSQEQQGQQQQGQHNQQAGQQGGSAGQQGYPDMQQNQQELLNSLQQQQRMQGM